MTRLDVALVELGLARSRSQAKELIGQGRVTLNNSLAHKAAAEVSATDSVKVTGTDHYVSRAAHKLLGALADLDQTPAGRALDAGASTGGFSQVLLEQGCSRVYSVDVGHGQLAQTLRSDPRIAVWERVNLRDLELRHVEDQPVDWIVADVSFISLTMLIEPLTQVLRSDGAMLLMIKPQFEVGREHLGKGGLVRSPALHRRAIEDVCAKAAAHGWLVQAVARSQLPGETGNVEYFAHFQTTAPTPPPDLALAVQD